MDLNKVRILKTLPIICLAFLCSCHSVNKAKEDKLSDKVSVHGKDFFLLDGSWLSMDYMNHIRDTKSPLLAYDMPKPVMVELFINTSALLSDTLDCGADYDLHEGGNFQIYFPENADGTFTIAHNGNSDLNDGKLKITIKKGDTILHLYNTNQEGKITKHYAYKRIFNPDTSDKQFSPLNYFVKGNLIAGSYKYNNEIVAFYANGKVDFPAIHHHYYDVLTDMCCPRVGADIIMFGDKPLIGTNFNYSQNLGYKVTKDSLLIYTLAQDTTVPTYTGLDSLKYKLVKNK